MRRKVVRQVTTASGVWCAESPPQAWSICSTTWRKPTLRPINWTTSPPPPPLPPPPQPASPCPSFPASQLTHASWDLHVDVSACEAESTEDRPGVSDPPTITVVGTSEDQTLPAWRSVLSCLIAEFVLQSPFQKLEELPCAEAQASAHQSMPS